MSAYVNNISPEAQLCAASSNAEFLLPLILLCESRTTLDLRALTNMKGGRLKSHHEESGEYADQLKAIDTALTAADSTRALLMPHGASTYTSVVLDLIQDAQQLYWEQTLPLGGSVATGGGATGTPAADIAAALAAASEASKLESSKECSTTYEQQRRAVIVSLYKIALGEEEHGNRNALYKANKFMGPTSSHQYPSPEQMHFMKLLSAIGGGSVAPLVGQVSASGGFGLAPGVDDPVDAANAYAVAYQAKLKVGTFFLELCGEPVPAGYDGKEAGYVPGRSGPTQMGLAEFRNYCTAVDRAAKVIKNKAIVEHLIDNNEKLLRSATSPTSHLTLAAALSALTPVLDQAIDQFSVAKMYTTATPAAAADGGRGAKRKDPPADGPKGGDDLGGLGPGGAFSRKQIDAMRKQAGGKGGGGGGGGWQGGGGGYWGGKGGGWGKGGGKGGGWNGGWQGAQQSWQGGGGWGGGGGFGGGNAGGSVPPAGAPPGAPPGGGGIRPVCRDFLNGNCTRGAQCRFAH